MPKDYAAIARAAGATVIDEPGTVAAPSPASGPPGPALSFLRAAGQVALGQPGTAEAAINALPFIGGAVTGIPASAAAGPAAPVAGPLAAFAGAGMGDVLRHAIRQRLGLEGPQSWGEAERSAALSGLTAGALPELTGQGMNALAQRAALGLAGRSGLGWSRKFNMDVAPVALEHAIPSGTGPRELQEPLAKVAARRQQSADALGGLLDQLKRSGWRATTKSFSPATAAVSKAVANDPAGALDMDELIRLVNDFESRNAGALTPMRVQRIKQRYQTLSYGSSAQGLGPLELRKASTAKLFYKAMADRAQRMLEEAPVVGRQIAAQNQETQGLMALEQALKRRRELKPSGLSFLRGAVPAAALGTLAGGGTYLATHNPIETGAAASFVGGTAALADAIARSPAAASRLAIALANPGTQAAARLAPYLGSAGLSRLLTPSPPPEYAPLLPDTTYSVGGQ